jgi:hypothetical protein
VNSTHAAVEDGNVIHLTRKQLSKVSASDPEVPWQRVIHSVFRDGFGNTRQSRERNRLVILITRTLDQRVDLDDGGGR